jgi:hypothetical protein
MTAKTRRTCTVTLTAALLFSVLLVSHFALTAAAAVKSQTPALRLPKAFLGSAVDDDFGELPTM